MAKKFCPRLRDSACWRSDKITQPVGQTFLANSVYRSPTIERIFLKFFKSVLNRGPGFALPDICIVERFLDNMIPDNMTFA